MLTRHFLLNVVATYLVLDSVFRYKIKLLALFVPEWRLHKCVA